MLKEKDITDYTFPFWRKDGDEWVKLSDVKEFKIYLVSQLNAKETEDSTEAGETGQ